jgi:hypothetical protein
MLIKVALRKLSLRCVLIYVVSVFLLIACVYMLTEWNVGTTVNHM